MGLEATCQSNLPASFMTATAHLLVGGAIAASVSNPPLGIILAAASHPLLDMIPHWDEGWGWRKKTKIRLFLESSADLLLGICLTYFLFGQFIQSWYFGLCLLASISWDLMEAPYLLLGWKIPPFVWFYKIQSRMQGKIKLPWGILTQLATVLVIVILLQTLPR